MISGHKIKRVNIHRENFDIESFATYRLTNPVAEKTTIPMAPDRVPNKLSIIYGGQKRDRPRSKWQPETRSRQQQLKRSHGNAAKDTTNGPRQTSPATNADGDDVQHLGAQAEGAAAGLGKGGPSAFMAANGPGKLIACYTSNNESIHTDESVTGAQDQPPHVNVALKRKAVPTAA